MGKAIPIDLNPTRAIEIDGGLVAHGLGLALPEFQQLMEHRKITVLCERGVGEHAGLYRATLERIEAAGFDVFAGPPRLSTATKLRIVGANLL